MVPAERGLVCRGLDEDQALSNSLCPLGPGLLAIAGLFLCSREGTFYPAPSGSEVPSALLVTYLLAVRPSRCGSPPSHTMGMAAEDSIMSKNPDTNSADRTRRSNEKSGRTASSR